MSLDVLDNDGPVNNRETQLAKAYTFTDQALVRLHKHFQRWCSTKLTPAALMAERELALCVSRAILGQSKEWPQRPNTEDPTLTDEQKYFMLKEWDFVVKLKSKAHHNIFLPDFEEFVNKRLEIAKTDALVGDACEDDNDGDVPSTEFSVDIKQAARFPLAGMDFRDVKAKESRRPQLKL